MGNEPSRAEDLRLSPEEEAELEREMEEGMEEGAGGDGGLSGARLAAHPHLATGPNWLPGEHSDGPIETALRMLPFHLSTTAAFIILIYPSPPSHRQRTAAAATHEHNPAHHRHRPTQEWTAQAA